MSHFHSPRPITVIGRVIITIITVIGRVIITVIGLVIITIITTGTPLIITVVIHFRFKFRFGRVYISGSNSGLDVFI